jgi:multidrug efflux pump subunit AcrA (membrane-fusion protein)
MLRLKHLRSAAILAFAAATLAACTESKGTAPEKADAPRAVVTQAVAFEPRTPSRTFVGTVRPRIESDLSFRVGGKVAERYVQNGERVAPGQVLARP